MCPKPVRLATALTAVLALATVATPAFALFGKAKPKAEAAAKPTEARPATAAAQSPEPQVRKATAEQRTAAERMDPLGRATFWLREHQADPGDVAASIKLSQALRALGRNEEATQAAGAAIVLAPTDVEALLEDARAKIGAGQAFYAIDSLKRAQAIAPKDWRPVSLMGVALEASERPDEAKAAYDQALALSPDNPAVLSNLALLLAGRGEPAQAEALLRKAVARPGVTIQERQNLALVLGLQGKLAEAERLMRQDLPPEIANANLAYFRGAAGPASSAAVASGRSWGALEGVQGAAPR
jgi:Flp pilus assembly protein TadD